MAIFKLNPQHAEAHYGLGVVYDDLGEKEKAVSSFKNFLKYCPEGKYLQQQDRARSALQK